MKHIYLLSVMVLILTVNISGCATTAASKTTASAYDEMATSGTETGSDLTDAEIDSDLSDTEIGSDLSDTKVGSDLSDTEISSNLSDTEIGSNLSDTAAGAAPAVPDSALETTRTIQEESIEASTNQADAGAASDSADSSADKTAAFARQIKEAVAASDMERLADLCGYPVYVSSATGDGSEITNKNDFIALGADTVFTPELKSAIAAFTESELEEYGAGVMIGENGAIVFNDVEGNLMITGINLNP